MLTDLAHAFRSLIRTPVSAGAAVLTIALVLGAGVSLVALVEKVLWTPLPYPAAESLVRVGEVPLSDRQSAMRPISRATFEAWTAAGAGSFDELEAFDALNVTLTGNGFADRVGANRVRPRFFTMVGVQPILGRLPTDSDSSKIVVISHDLWRTRFGADPSALGRILTIGAEPHAVIGVLPEGFHFPLGDADLWMPLAAPTADDGTGRVLRVIGRLAPGRTPPAAAASLDSVSGRSVPASRAVAQPLRDAVIGNAAATLWLLVAAAAFALLMAAANLAGLLLLRWADRERELALRAALGASQWALVRSIVAESHLIVAGGAAGGLLLSMWLSPIVRRIAADQIATPVSTQSTFGSATLWLLTAGSLFAAWASAAQPIGRALRSSRLLESAHRGSTRPVRGLAGRGLIVGQLVISFVLLAAVVLVGQSLQRLLSANAGFTIDRILTMRVALPAAVYRDNASVAAFYSALELRLRERFGQSVAIVDELPLTHDRGRVDIARAPALDPVDVVIRMAGQGYFDVMSIPVLSGRAFDATDDATAPPRVVLAATLARRLFPDRDAAGQRVWLPGRVAWAEVVGVVGDVKLASLDEPGVPLIYVAATQQPSRGSHIVIRSEQPDALVLGETRRVVAALDPDVPVYAAQPLEQVVRMSRGLPARRMLAATFSGFTILALTLTAVGLFGVLSHHVTRRRREIAVRMSLGASPQRLRAGIVLQTAWLTVAGISGGAMLSIPTSASLRRLIGDAGPIEVTPYLASAIMLLVVALGAAFGPAQRAARTDPAVMLRAE